MNLSLSPADQARLQESVQALLSPLDYPDVDAWRCAATVKLKELLGADIVSFLLPSPGIPLAFSNELPDRLGQYPESIDPLHQRFNSWKRHIPLGVCDRATLWGAHLDEYYRSAYYHEFVIPLRAFDYVGMAVSLERPWSTRTVATLMFHHESEAGPKFGERGLSLLRLAFPAFKAGVRTFVRLQQNRTSFLRAIDALEAAVAVFDFSGRMVHRNPALGSLLAEDPEREAVMGKASRIAQTCVNAQLHLWGAFRDGYPSQPVMTVSTRKMKYRLSGSYIGAREVGVDTYVLVTVEPSRRSLPTVADLRERFGLTKREAEVALLLAQRKRNKEISECLCIGERTARHHAEHVLQKLGIHSRDEVEKALLR